MKIKKVVLECEPNTKIGTSKTGITKLKMQTTVVMPDGEQEFTVYEFSYQSDIIPMLDVIIEKMLRQLKGQLMVLAQALATQEET